MRIIKMPQHAIDWNTDKWGDKEFVAWHGVYQWDATSNWCCYTPGDAPDDKQIGRTPITFERACELAGKHHAVKDAD